MKNRVPKQLQPIALQSSSQEGDLVSNEQIESKMRVLANYLIDRVLEIQNEAVQKGLNINDKNATLIMELLTKSELP